MKLDKLLKNIDFTQVIIIFAGLALLYALYTYSQKKSLSFDGMEGGAHSHNVAQNVNVAPHDLNDAMQTHISDVQSSNVLPESAGAPPLIDPAELLPRDENSEWAALNPMGSGDLQNVNLLQSGHHLGINTVSSSLRNASYDIRGDVPNPQAPVGPWNQTTIQPDINRRPLEVGTTPLSESAF